MCQPTDKTQCLKNSSVTFKPGGGVVGISWGGVGGADGSWASGVFWGVAADWAGSAGLAAAGAAPARQQTSRRVHIRKGSLWSITWGVFMYSGRSLAFEEMRKPYASEQEICVQKSGNEYWQNGETNGAFQILLYHHQTIQRNTEMWFANDAFVIICILRLNPTFAYPVCITYMILRTARCVLYTEICVNASRIRSTMCWSLWMCEDRVYLANCPMGRVIMMTAILQP